MKKRFLAALFALVMVLSLVGMASAAPEEEEEDPPVTETSVTVTLEPSKLVLKLNDDKKGWTVIDGRDCSGSVEIPATHPYGDGDDEEDLPVTAIGGYTGDDRQYVGAFQNNKNLTGIKIPNTVTIIGPSAFANAQKLTGTVKISKNVTQIGDSAFDSCFQLLEVAFEDNEDDSSHTLTIQPYAFHYCTALKSVDFPQHTTYIKNNAFYECSNLESVFIWTNMIEEGDQTGPAEAFQLCPKLKNVFLSEKVKTISATPYMFDPPKPSSDDSPAADPLVIHHALATRPSGSGIWTTHQLQKMEKRIIDPDCNEKGLIHRLIMCTYDHDLPDYVNVDTEPDPLGHDYTYEKNPGKAGDYDDQLKDWKDTHEYEVCQSFDWVYQAKCSRCKSTKPVDQSFVSKEPHTLSIVPTKFNPDYKDPEDPENSDYPGLDYDSIDWDTLGRKEEEFNVTKPTCGETGRIDWVEKCEVCGEEESQHVILRTSEEHTFTKNNKADKPITIPATCLHPGFEVWYYACDGADLHDAWYKPCEGDEPVQDIPCKEVQAFVDAVDALNDKIAELEKNDAPALEFQENEDLKELREKVEQAAKNCDAHLFKHQNTKNDTCLADYIPTDKLDSDTHPDGSVKDVKAPYYTAPDKESPFLCVDGGWIITEGICKYCGHDANGEDPVTPNRDGHVIPSSMVHKISEATCLKAGQIQYDEGAECLYEGGDICTFKVDKDTIIDDPTDLAQGHDWGEFVPLDPDEDMHQNENCVKRVVEGFVHCLREEDFPDEHPENEFPQKTTKTIPGKAGHTWSDWEVAIPATPEKDGLETRHCLVKECGETDERPLSYVAPDTGDGDGDDGSGGSGGSGDTTPKPNPDATYTISVTTDGNGKASASATSAKAGASITITVTANSGYELDLIRVISDTSVVSTTSLGGGRYSFTMPASSVKVGVTFSQVASSAGANWTGSSGSSSSSSSSSQNVVRSIPQAGAAGQQLFRDIPATHWAAGEINWANQMGYMNGTNGSFNPDGIVSHQQLWMILARLTGNNPTSMADAKHWAILGGFADGSAPEGSVNRHQLVTALYRCAHLMGTVNRNTTSLAGFPDSRIVPIGAREPFAWAIANGIIGGNADGRLDPNGTLTRAQIAVILYRFSQRV